MIMLNLHSHLQPNVYGIDAHHSGALLSRDLSCVGGILPTVHCTFWGVKFACTFPIRVSAMHDFLPLLLIIKLACA